ncbi:biotin/lipoyl attachment domain-containing protein [Sesbania bispinosa]|nr:biotin/lipoyl attachment domain-containing protein [Sesbania bispinosa]
MLNNYFLTSGPTGFMSHMQSSLQKPGVIPIQNVGWNSQSRLFIQSLAIGEKRINSHNKWKRTLVSSAKTAEAIDTTKSEGGLFGF